MPPAARLEVPPASTASSSAVPAPQTGWLTATKDRLLLPGFLLPAGALYALFVLWPLARTVWLAFQRWSGYGPTHFTGLTNITTLAGDPFFRDALAHSALWEAGAAILGGGLGLGLALLLQRAPLRSTALAILFFPALLPATVIAAVWTLVYSPLDGLLNTLLRAVGLGGLAGAWLGDPHLALPALFAAWLWSAIGIATLICSAGLGAIGRDYVDLALAEGAGPVQRLRYVLLPALRRPLAIAVLIEAALAAAVFDLVFVTTGGGPGDATMLLPLDMYGRAFGGHAGQGAAVALAQVLLGLLLAVLALLLIRGDAAGMNDGIPYTPRPLRGAARFVRFGAVLLLLLVLLLPLLWLIAVALGLTGLTVGVAPAGWDPASWDWRSFADAWNAGFGGALLTSLGIGLVATLLTVPLALLAAFALLRLRRTPWVSLRALVAALLLLGLFQPTPVLIIPLFDTLKTWGLLNSVGGVILPEVARTMPFAVLLLWAFFSQLPREVLQAAEVDGADPWAQLTRIAVPLARPAVAAVTIWAFVTSWNEYLLPTLVSQDGSLSTVPTLLGTFIGRYDTEYALLAAGSLIAMLPSLLLYLLLRRPAGAALSHLEREIT